MRRIDIKQIKEILVISLTNIGDVILTFPVIDILKNDFPDANISIVVGPKAIPLVKDNPLYKKIYCYNKQNSLWERFEWIGTLRKGNFDLIVDLRNTAIPLMLSHKWRTPFFQAKDNRLHMREKHLERLSQVHSFTDVPVAPKALFISVEDRKLVDDLILIEMADGPEKPFVIVAPGAANHDKRWNKEGFAKVCSFIQKTYGYTIVFVGDEKDKAFAGSIISQMEIRSVNGCGRISLTQLAYLMQKSLLVISNDSSPMHLASYLNVPVVAIFGPSNPVHYGPWSKQGVYVKKAIQCKRCLNPKIQEPHVCMRAEGDEVIKEVEKILTQ